MTLKGVLDRKLIMLIVSPLLRRLGTMLAAYLVAKGAPADQLDQLLTALAAVLGLSVDIVLATVERKRVENVGARKMLDSLEKTDTDVNWDVSR